MENKSEKQKINSKSEKGFIRRNLTTIILLTALLIGIVLLLYPTVSDYWNSFHQSRMIAAYDEAAAELSAQEVEAVIEEARQYNCDLLAKNDRWTMSDADMKRYLSILDITGTGIMGYIDIPRANIELPIYHTTDDKYLNHAAGHIETTSFPVGGSGCHSAISGHRGLPSAKLFTDLDRLNEGDLFQITILKQHFTYEVDKISIVLPNDTELLEIYEDKDYCTLITCTPYAVNTHRLLIRGHRVSDYLFDKEKIPGDATKYEPILVAPIVAIPILFVLFIIMLITTRKPKDKNKKDKQKNLP